jgi:hypothetical protein
MRRRVNRLLTTLVVVWFCAFMIASFEVPRAEASSGYLIKDEFVGPYHISIWASPNPISVGRIKLSIRLGVKAGISQELPARGANITVQFKQITGPGTEDNPKKLLISNVLVAPENDPGNYEVADSLDTEGVFRVIMNIDGAQGKEKFEFEVTALPQPEDRIFSIFLLVMLAIFVFALVFTYLKQSGQEVKTVNKTATPPEEIGSTKTEEKINQ